MPSSAASAASTILRTGLVAGTLDITAAITVYAFILDKVTALQLLQSVASGVYGRQAFTGGLAMGLAGLLFHYLIALTFTTAYYLVYPYLPFLQRHPVISGIVFGIVVWSIMNLLVLPLSNCATRPLQLGPSLLGMAIIIVMIGLPVALLTKKLR
ncbi:DUF1440 domain-containing protein [Chitinophaga agrisoli]|uniref:DUF1440 domain-containing protein n=1 Tax=Chitinophaga agrisoli TaxID=2607653 RepID=A0A5B2VWV8_9BACT|nr:DUF1440 domain-containing protein [Chitinophaga agrisoli]KAA2243088.1 DUF1440 domain-containing protein [Chitinophaga agrisoli]